MTNLFTFNGLEGQKGTISRVCLGFVSVLSRLSLGFLSVKSWRICALLFCLLFIGVGQMWATSYTITFNTAASGDGTAASTSTAASSLISSGSTYVTGNLVTATQVYSTSKNALKIGAKSSSGEVKINLATSYQLTNPTIIVKAKRYNSGTAASVAANGATAIAIPATSNWYYFAFPISGKITYLDITATKYIGVESVTITDECNAIDVTGGSTVTLPLGSTTYNAYDWSKAGAPWAQAAAASFPISSNYYCTSFTQVKDAGNANGLTCKAKEGIVSISGITSNCGVDVSVAVSGTNNFTVSLTGAAANVTGNNTTLSISTTSTTATLTISKTTSSDGYIKYIQIAPRTPCCTELASLNGSFFWTTLFCLLRPDKFREKALFSYLHYVKDRFSLIFEC